MSGDAAALLRAKAELWHNDKAAGKVVLLHGEIKNLDMSMKKPRKVFALRGFEGHGPRVKPGVTEMAGVAAKSV